MASPTHEIDLQTISLEDLVHNLTAKMEVLVDSISILSCKSSSEFGTNLMEMGEALDLHDEMANEFNKRVDELHAHTSEIGELLESVQEENRMYKHTLDTLPDIPGMKTTKTAETKQQTVQVKEKVALPQIKKSSKVSKLPSRIGFISEKEFDKTPGYLRGRMAYEKFSSLVEKLQSVLDEKYKIANLPLSKVPMSKLKLYHDFKDAEIAYTKGGYFFVEEDINNLSGSLVDPAMRNALMILRHHHIIKEVRGNKLVRYLVLDYQ